MDDRSHACLSRSRRELSRFPKARKIAEVIFSRSALLPPRVDECAFYVVHAIVRKIIAMALIYRVSSSNIQRSWTSSSYESQPVMCHVIIRVMSSDEQVIVLVVTKSDFV